MRHNLVQFQVFFQMRHKQLKNPPILIRPACQLGMKKNACCEMMPIEEIAYL